MMDDDKQLEFEFMDDLRQHERQKVKDSLVYYPHPENDNQRLLNYQYEWIKNGDSCAEGRLWMLARKVAMRMVRKEEKKRGCYFDSLTREDKAADAVMYVLRRYKRNWFVRHSFLDALWHGVKHALDYRTHAEEAVSFVSDDVLQVIKQQKEEEQGEIYLRVDGMSKEQVEQRIRESLLPEIADRLIEDIKIIEGAKK